MPEKSLVDAVWCNRQDMVKKHLAEGSDPGSISKKTAMPVLTVASMNGNVDIIHQLIKAGANVNLPDDGGTTALYWAARQGQMEAVKVLLSSGANVNARASDGSSPLSMTLGDGVSIGIPKLLLENGANPNAEHRGLTAFMFACMLGKTEWVRMFIQSGADINHVAANGMSAMSVAREPHIVSLLRNAGAK